MRTQSFLPTSLSLYPFFITYISDLDSEYNTRVHKPAPRRSYDDPNLVSTGPRAMWTALRIARIFPRARRARQPTVISARADFDSPYNCLIYCNRLFHLAERRRVSDIRT